MMLELRWQWPGRRVVTGRGQERVMFHFLIWMSLLGIWSLCENSSRYTLGIGKCTTPINVILLLKVDTEQSFSSFSSLPANPRRKYTLSKRWAIWKHTEVWLCKLLRYWQSYENLLTFFPSQYQTIHIAINYINSCNESAKRFAVNHNCALQIPENVFWDLGIWWLTEQCSELRSNSSLKIAFNLISQRRCLNDPWHGRGVGIDWGRERRSE